MKRTLTHKPAYCSMFLLLLFTILTNSCKKENLYGTIPLLNVADKSASAIRLYNFDDPTDVTVNSIPLTAYANPNTPTTGTALGLSIFPTGIWTNGDDGSPFVVPNSLLDKDGKAHFTMLIQSTITSGSVGEQSTIDTTIMNNAAQPQDYYLMPNGHFKVVNRDNVPPTNSQNFKIRVINLGSNVYGDPSGLNIKGPVSLTYADGSPVSPALNNVAQGAASGYVELPYRAYQFKLFIANGAIDVTRQLAEIPSSAYYIPGNFGPLPQEGLIPRVRTFKPGGVYSIIVSENIQPLYRDVNRFTSGMPINSYRVITELDPGVNSTYAAMQAVNAIPGKQLTINVDGQPLGGPLPYAGSVASNTAQQAPYQIYVQGTHHIQAKDQSGNVLAEKDIQLFPYDNYTIWAYDQPDGKPALLFEANDMTGTLYLSQSSQSGYVAPDDGTNGTLRRGQYNYALESRFLNLNPDLPYATFTNDNQLFLPAVATSGIYQGDTIRFFSAYVNLAPGAMPPNNSSILYSLPFVSPAATGVPFGNSEKGIVPQLIRVYQSKPGDKPEVPGLLLTTVAPINVLQAFIANPALYTAPQFKTAETGIYTVALVGAINASGTTDKAKLIVIKHNK
ncbi:hypothetical protein SAMN05216490_1560 [Mucilaginibacter mallensis]|uniref:DUF4397 domain-containing protein n=1 Tax=Mucilaginibacter mallensis TaxID=652787 RepID=A0A1H1U0G3_MUCMA|nr:hypothetical protein [Mucilaginibacter mallensis]SDS65844.1 hypothetical protein SAMN05216490_1560 [Mucilaginibacter mallensis]